VFNLQKDTRLLIKSFLEQSVLMNQSYRKHNTVVSLRNKSPLLYVKLVIHLVTT